MLRPGRKVDQSVQTDQRDSDSQRPFTLRKGFIPEPLQSGAQAVRWDAFRIRAGAPQ